MKPRSYWRLIASTFLSASAMYCAFSGGMTASETEPVLARLVDYLKPCALMRSSISEVLAVP